MRVIELEGIDNVRDIGGIAVADGRVLRHGIFYRGSALVGLTPEDRRMLFDECAIGCVVDLRCAWEREARPSEVNGAAAEFHIPFFDMDMLGVDYTRTAPGTKMVGHDIACEPAHLYRSIANEVTMGQIRLALHRILEHACRGIASYQHCSGGKDRTGIMTMLLLKTLGASDEDIINDYLFTNEARDRHYDQNFARFLRLAQGDEELAHSLVMSHRADERNLRIFMDAIDELYDGMEALIAGPLGISDEDRSRIIQLCTEND